MSTYVIQKLFKVSIVIPILQMSTLRVQGGLLLLLFFIIIIITTQTTITIHEHLF